MDKDRETSPSSSWKKKRNTATGMHCMAPGCTNNRKNNTQVHYHRLPLSNKPLLKQWMAKMKLANPPKLSFARLCGQHFTPDDYQTKGHFDDCGRYHQLQTANLKPTAVPTLFDFSGYSHGLTDAPSTSTRQLSGRSRRLTARHHKQEQQQNKQVCQVRARLCMFMVHTII